MIENNIRQSERLEKLNSIARRELSVLSNDKNVVGIENLEKNINRKLLGIK